mgnify:CR=1 FL=1
MRHVAVIKKYNNGLKKNDYPMVRVTQVGKAQQAGFSAMGKRYLRGDLILHISSARATGEVFTFTRDEVMSIYLEFARTKYHRKIKPSRAREAATKVYEKIHG